MIEECVKKKQLLIIYKESKRTKDGLRWFTEIVKNYEDWEYVCIPVSKGNELALTNSKNVDLILAIGGDGTFLYSVWQYQDSSTPPIAAIFVGGTLGFLSTFRVRSKDDTEELFKVLFYGNIKELNYKRLLCNLKTNGQCNNSSIKRHVLNEVVVDRGSLPGMVLLELYIDGELITIVDADGLIIATPTGSTAYSLSAGGSLVHPSTNAIVLTPICPHNLSFRPIILPWNSVIKLKISPESRSPARVTFDGQECTNLVCGEELIISASPYPVKVFIKNDAKTKWLRRLSTYLKWNVSYKVTSSSNSGSSPLSTR